MAHSGFRHKAGFKQLAFFTFGLATVLTLLLGGFGSPAHTKLVAQPASSYSVPHHQVASATSPVLHLRLKAGHTYYLSGNQMNHIVGSSNLQIKQGTTGVLANPPGDSQADMAEQPGWWLVEYPTLPEQAYQGPYANNGWSVRYSKTAGLSILVPANAPIGTEYYAFYATSIVRTPDGHGGWYVDTVGVSAYFDVVS